MAYMQLLNYDDKGAMKNAEKAVALDPKTGQAIAAARKIRFTPAMRDGKPLTVIGSLEFTFNLY